MREKFDSASHTRLARTVYEDARELINDKPNIVFLLDLAYASLEFERAFGQDFSARDTFLDAFDLLRASRGIGPWLYGGAAHVGWTAIQISRHYGIRVTGLDHLDSMIIDWAVNYPTDHDVDLPAGLLGLGVYGLIHPSRAVREKLTSAVIETVTARVEEDDGSFLRLGANPARLRNRPHVVGHRDLGVAHGNAGLVSYLASASMSGLSSAATAADLLNSVLRWLLRQRHPGDGTVFPHSVETRYEPSRSAWCYGDPGVSMALDVAAQATGSTEVAAAATEAAAAAVSRPANRARVVDATLCHGAAGLCWFGRRARERWRFPDADAFVAHWADYLHQERARGPLHYVVKDANRRDPSFLDGDLGVALALLYLARGGEPAWQERMLATPLRPAGE